MLGLAHSTNHELATLHVVDRGESGCRVRCDRAGARRREAAAKTPSKLSGTMAGFVTSSDSIGCGTSPQTIPKSHQIAICRAMAGKVFVVGIR